MANELISLVNDARLDSGGFAARSCAVGHWAGDPTNGAIRFENLQIAKNQSIDSAYLIYKYSSVGSTSGNWKFILYGIDEDNTNNFDEYPFGRSRTTSSNTYNEGPPTSGGTKTMDVKSILQEITTRDNWSFGNYVGFILDDAGSSTDVYAFLNNSLSYLVYRLSAEPNFKPTPISIAAPSLPAAQDIGIKISQPGVSVLEATDNQLYFTTRRKQVKIFAEDVYTSTGAGNTVIAHNLGYIPMVTVYGKEYTESGDTNWRRLPDNQLFDDHQWYIVDDTNLFLHSAQAGEKFYYRILLDRIST